MGEKMKLYGFNNLTKSVTRRQPENRKTISLTLTNSTIPSV